MRYSARRLIDRGEIERLIDVAMIYAEDGAPATAAERLRVAAQHIERVAAQLDEWHREREAAFRRLDEGQ